MRSFLPTAILLLGALLLLHLLPLCMARGYPCSRPCVRPYKPMPKHRPYLPHPKRPCPPKVRRPPVKPPRLTCPMPPDYMDGCVNQFGGLITIVIGQGLLQQCCPLFHGLEPEVASHCLCRGFQNAVPNPSSFSPRIKDLLGGCGYPPVDVPCA